MGAVAVPVLGRLGDLKGERRMLLVCLAAMAVGSLICALGSSFPVLLLGRAVQGVAAGTVPLGISLVARTAPPHARAAGVGVVSGMLGVGGALGLPLAGVIADRADYHVLFWVTCAASSLALAGIALLVRTDRAPGTGRLDGRGAVILSAALLTLLLPLSEASAWGWTNPLVWGLLVCSVLLFGVFARSQTRSSEPLVDLTTLRRRPILLVDAAAVLVGFSMFGSILGTSSYVEAPVATGYGFASSVTTAGLAMLPAGLAMLVAAPITTRLVRRWGAPGAMTLGCLVIVVGWAMRIVVTGTLALVTTGTAVVGLGVGICFAAMPLVISAHAPRDQVSAANAVNALARSIGISVITALTGSLLTTLTLTLGDAVLPSLTAYRVVFGLCGAGALLAAVMSRAIPSARASRSFAELDGTVPSSTV